MFREKHGVHSLLNPDVIQRVFSLPCRLAEVRKRSRSWFNIDNSRRWDTLKSSQFTLLYYLFNVIDLEHTVQYINLQ